MAQSKIASTQDKLLFVWAHDGSPGANRDQYVDIAQCLSIVNRRFYRQGMNYAVGSIEFFARSGGRVEVGIVPCTWVADNSTTKAFENWKDQRAEVLKESPTLKAKWSDFKVHLDERHATVGFANNLTPVDSDGDVYALGEWSASEFVVPIDGGAGGLGNAQEVTMHVVGDHIPNGPFNNFVTSAGLIKSYADSRSIILAPDPVQPPGYNTNMYIRESSHDEMSADIIQNVTNFNDMPPYDLDNYPGGDTQAPTAEYVDTGIVSNYGDTTVFSKAVIAGFVAPLGLLKFTTYDFAESEDISMVINLVPGNYKGILAEGGL